MERTLFIFKYCALSRNFQKLFLLFAFVFALEICSVLNADAQRRGGGHSFSRGRGHFSRVIERGDFYSHGPRYSTRFYYRGHDFNYRPSFYRPYYDRFSIFGPPFGFRIGFLPRGCFSFYLGGFPYYYYEGIYYVPRGDRYEVVAPPVGAVVETLPPKYDKVEVDGQTYYTSNGVQYKPVMKDGEIWYQVIKSPAKAPAPDKEQNDDVKE